MNHFHHTKMIHSLPPLMKATVVNRPSKIIKSPYVADIKLEDGTEALCHSPGLGCCGLVSKGKTIYVSKATNKNAKTAYTAQVSESTDEIGTYYIGIHPMTSQHIAAKLLNKIADLKWKSEVAIDKHTRLDYVGTHSTGKKIYVEVKNAMISSCIGTRESRRALFPDGFRKNLSVAVSPRAVKHAEVLADLLTKEDTHSAYLVFIVPRNDCGGGLELNKLDPIYCKAVSKAVEAGLQVRVFSLLFQKDGSVEFDKEHTLIIPPC
jgi:DNA-binding sugar fermentation-stimulating protein